VYKSICAMAVVLVALAFVSGSRSADASPTTPISPPIVAHAKLPNQTAPITTTTILTSKTTGVYRITVYPTLTTSNPSSQSTWDLNLYWSDDGGPESMITGGWLSGSQTGWGGAPGWVYTVEATAGSTISYSVTQSGPPDGSVYSLYYTVERLE
jgi:hypothetical protein